MLRTRVIKGCKIIQYLKRSRLPPKQQEIQHPDFSGNGHKKMPCGFLRCKGPFLYSRSNTFYYITFRKEVYNNTAEYNNNKYNARKDGGGKIAHLCRQSAHISRPKRRQHHPPPTTTHHTPKKIRTRRSRRSGHRADTQTPLHSLSCVCVDGYSY